MSAQTSRGGIGSHKHGVSGRATRSPRFRAQVRQAVDRDNDRRDRTSRGKRRLQRWTSDVRQLLRGDA